MSRDVTFVADLSHVREVALLGTADHDFWSARLSSEDLRPALHDGRAHVLLTAMEGVFRGLRFREVSVAIPLAGGDSHEPAGIFLVHAFNSSRLFACCERFFFHTPYWPATIAVQLEPAPQVEVRTGGGGRLRLTMSPAPSETRQPTSVGLGGWEGPVLLPSRRREAVAARRWFWAVISGETQTFAAAASDRCEWTLSPDAAVFQDLSDSRFTPLRWELRAAARHAKSKTYRRGGYGANSPPTPGCSS